MTTTTPWWREGRILIRRKLFAVSVAVTALSVSGTSHAQLDFADVAGEWEGNTTGDVKLALFLSRDGRYALKFLTGPGAGSMPRGRATRQDDVVVLKYGDTDISLTKSTDGKLSGPFSTPRVSGGVTFIRKSGD
jgi:hypothetical protein